jgi:WD40 repeat protein/tetratricopeptide (TPR) repeat protein
MRVWDLKSRNAIVMTIRQVPTGSFATADSRFVLTQSGERTVQVLDTTSGKPTGPPIVAVAPIRQALLAGGGTRVLLTFLEQRKGAGRIGPGTWTLAPPPQLWDVATGKQISLSLALPSRNSFSWRAWAVSPDGRLLAAGANNDQGVRVLDAITGKSVFSFSLPEKSCDILRFSDDGRVLLAMFNPFRIFPQTATHVYVLNTHTGKPLGPAISLDAASGRVFTLSPNNRRLASVDREGGLRVWSVATGLPASKSMRHDGPIQKWGFSADGRYLLSSSADNAVRVWAAFSGHPVTPVLKHDRNVVDFRQSPDGSRVLTIAGNVARLWPVASPSLERAVLPHENPVQRVQLSDNGKRVLTTSLQVERGGGFIRYRSMEIQVWDAESGALIRRKKPSPGSALGQMADLSPDGRRALITYRMPGGEMAPTLLCEVWDIDADTLTPLEAPPESGGAVSFSADGRWICVTVRPNAVRGTAESGAAYKPIEVRLWDAVSVKPAGPAIKHPEPAFEERDGVFGAMGRAGLNPYQHVGVWSRDGTRYVLADHRTNGIVFRVWDTRTGKELFETSRHVEPADLVNTAFSDDGRRLLTLTRPRRPGAPTARVWDLSSGALLLTVPVLQLRSRFGARDDASLSPDGSRLLVMGGSGSGESGIRVWEVASGKTSITPLSDEAGVEDAVFSPDGSRIVTTSTTGAVRVWDAVTGEPRTGVLENGGPAVSVRFSGDGRRILSHGTFAGSRFGGGPFQLVANELRVWDSVTGQPLSPPLRSFGARVSRFPAGVRSLFPVSGDGNRLLLVDGTHVRVCELSGETRPIEELLALTQALASRRVNDAGNLQVLEEGRFESGWSQLRAREAQGAGRLAPSGAEWHRRQARECGYDKAILPAAGRASAGDDARGAAFAAVWHLDRLIAADPKEPQYYSARAAANVTLRQWKQALSDYTRGIDGKTDNSWVDRANVHAELGRWKEAAADYRRAIDDDQGPSFLKRQLQLSLAVLCLQQGDELGFQTICEKLLSEELNLHIRYSGRFPADPGVIARSHFALSPRGVKDPAKLAAQLEKLAKEDDSPNPIFIPLGPAYYRAGRHEDAIQAFRDSRSVRSSTGADWFFLAMAQHRCSDKEQQAQARASLSRGAERMEAEERDRSESARFPGPFVTTGWRERLINRMLLREAVEELKKPAGGGKR